MKNSIFNFVFVVMFITLFPSCKKNTENNIIGTIEVNSTTTVNISDLFVKFDIIQLATTDSSLIGLQIEKVEFYENKIFMLNRMYSHKNILCFDFAGNFLFKIDQMGHGPQEYTYLGDFFIDKLRERIIIQSENNRYLFFCLDGKYIDETTGEDDYFARQILFLNDSSLVVCNDALIIPFGYNLLEVNSKTFNIRNKSNRIKEVFDNSGSFPLATHTNQILYYSTNDTIYDISHFNKEKAIYYVNFGEKQRKLKNALPSMTSENYEEISNNVISAFENDKMIIVHSLFENSSWIALSLLKYRTRGNPISSFILYDKNKKCSYASEHIVFDTMNLPKLTDIKVIGCDEDKILLIINQEFSNEDKIKIKECHKLSNEAKKILTERTFDDNPLLIILK